MDVAIIGAGFTGLAAAYSLSKKGCSVELFELDDKPGGLAIGYQEKNWEWTLEKHYHHWFTNDTAVLNLAKEIEHTVVITRPKTSSLVDGDIYQLDSPTSLLTFPKLSPLDRLRMGIALAFLRFNPYWKPFEYFRAEPYLKMTMGEKGYGKIWEPLMVNKLGKYSKEVSLAWFWARVYKRTSSLAYPEGGFLSFAKHLEEKIIEKKGSIHYSTTVTNISSDENPVITFQKYNNKPTSKQYDKVIVTLPTQLFLKIARDLPQSYKTSFASFKGIAAMNVVLRLNKPFFTDGTYWLNMCDLKSPILAIVEHTNFMNPKHYNNEHIVYLGNYLETNDIRYSLSGRELLALYDPWLKTINQNYSSTIIDMQIFRAPFAQPIIPPRYSQHIPSFITPYKNVFLANIQQVYPWDRGTNYAVELGERVAHHLYETPYS